MPHQVVPSGYSGQGPSCWQKVKMGALMGASIGAGIGILVGGFGAFGAGLRGREMLRYVGKSVVSSGGAFGMFMGVGVGLRC